MSDPRHPSGSDRPVLEPWAVEIEESEPGGADPATCDELARVAALLRSLPDPEPPVRLSEEILARVSEDAARPRVLRGAFGAPRRFAALALAAGVAGLLVLTAGPEPMSLRALWNPIAAGDAKPDHVVIRLPEVTRPSRLAAAGVFSVPGPAVGAQPQLVSLLGRAPGAPLPQRFFDPTTAVSAWDRQLDHQLNQLQLDPHAFAERLESVARHDDFIARLARRAGDRGDAAEIAMRVRRSDHPLSAQIVNRLLRASLVERASRR